MDAGCDETLVVTFTGDGKIQQPVLNEKCAAGVGGFLQNMARRLELSLEEMSALPPIAEGGAVVNDGCVVFAELDALSLLNQGVSPGEIASAVTDAAAIRACTVISDVTIPAFDRVVLLGGLTKNKAFVHALETRAGFAFIIPEKAEYAGAFGAALIAVG
jgi:activator of 2-hydroxyglutaryl-CoA dehydratase